jgi:hypothetical protein
LGVGRCGDCGDGMVWNYFLGLKLDSTLIVQIPQNLVSSVIQIMGVRLRAVTEVEGLKGHS